MAAWAGMCHRPFPLLSRVSGRKHPILSFPGGGKKLIHASNLLISLWLPKYVAVISSVTALWWD